MRMPGTCVRRQKRDRARLAVYRTYLASITGPWRMETPSSTRQPIIPKCRGSFLSIALWVFNPPQASIDPASLHLSVARSIMGTPGPAQECGLETLLTPDQDSLETIIEYVELLHTRTWGHRLVLTCQASLLSMVSCLAAESAPGFQTQITRNLAFMTGSARNGTPTPVSPSMGTARPPLRRMHSRVMLFGVRPSSCSMHFSIWPREKPPGVEELFSSHMTLVRPSSKR